MNGSYYSAAVLSETPLVALSQYAKLASQAPIPANTSFFGYAVRLYDGAPSINCLIAPVKVSGDIVVIWTATNQTCPKQ
jgi:hypothetical protein